MRATQTLRIKGSAERVWDAFSDWGGIWRFQPWVTRSPLLSEHNEGVGASRRCEFTDGTSIVETVLEVEPGRRIVMSMADAPKPMKGGTSSIELTPSGAYTEVTVVIEAELSAGPLNPLLSMMMKPMMRKRVRKMLESLEFHLETGGKIDAKGVRRPGRAANVAALLCVALFLGPLTQGCDATASGGERDALATASTRQTPAQVSQALAREHTNAPQRFLVSARLDAPREQVWNYVSDHDNLVEYSGGVLTGVEVDRTGANGTNGVGARRTCSVGEDRFVEEVLVFEPLEAFAYSAVKNTWGLEQHLVTIHLVPRGGSTDLHMGVYFNTASPGAADQMAKNMQGMIRGPMMTYLTKRFGGRLL